MPGAPCHPGPAAASRRLVKPPSMPILPGGGSSWPTGTARKTASRRGRRAMRASAPMSAAWRRGSPGRGSSAREGASPGNAAALAAALGGLKGPLMKVAQLLATIPDVLPPEYAEELSKLQSQAPPMGWAFVKRRMMAELGADWAARFGAFEREPAAAASLGQVHRATAQDGSPLGRASCNIPTCSRRSRRTCRSSRCCSPSTAAWIRPSTPARSIAEIGERVREELDYRARGQACRALSRHLRAARRHRGARAAGPGRSSRPAAS